MTAAARSSAALVPLVDLAQSALGFFHRALARLAAFLQALLGEAQVGGRRDLRVGAGACGATGGGPGTARAAPVLRRRRPELRLRRGRLAEGIHRRGGLGLQAFGLADPTIGLGPDPLLLLAHLRNFVTHAPFGGGGVLVGRADTGRGEVLDRGGGSWVGSGGGGARGGGVATFSSTGAAGGGVGASTVGGDGGTLTLPASGASGAGGAAAALARASAIACSLAARAAATLCSASSAAFDFLPLPPSLMPKSDISKKPFFSGSEEVAAKGGGVTGAPGTAGD